MKKRSIGSIQHLGDNKYRLRVSAGYDDFGRRIQRSRVIEAKSHTDAERQLLKLYNDSQKDVVSVSKDDPKTLGELYSRFESEHMSELRRNTQGYYNQLWESQLKQYEKTRLSKVSQKHVRSIISAMTAGDRTKRGVFEMLNTMFRFASTDNKYMQHNPCEKMKPPKYKAKEKKPYSEAELAEVIACVEKEPVKFQLLFYLATMLGMRRSEIVGLQWSDIDFKSNTLSIQRAAGWEVGKGTYIDDTKTEKSVRVLHIPDIVRQKLLVHQEDQRLRRERLLDKWIPGDWIFTQWNGEIMSVNTPTVAWSKFMAAHPELRRVTFHDLRHTAATLLIKNNVAVSTVSGILGHSQISTTLDVYTHAIEDAKKDALRAMESIFDASKSTIQSNL